MTFQCLGLVLALGMWSFYKYENRRRDRVEGGRPAKGERLNTVEQYDLAPGESSWLDGLMTGFRYVA